MHGVNVVEFRSDGGGEHTSTELKQWLKANITWTPNTPCVSEQNAMSERCVRTIVTKVRCVLKQCGKPTGCWCYAIDVAVISHNVTWNSAVDRPHSNKH